MTLGDDVLNKMILEGAVEVAGVDSNTGEFLYSFTDKLPLLYPEMYKKSIDHFNSYVMELWVLGMLKMNPDEVNPKVSLTSEAFNDSKLEILSDELLAALNTIKNAMRNQRDV